MAGLLILLLPPVLFAAAEGPAMYCLGRGWLPLAAYNTTYGRFWMTIGPALPVDVQERHLRYKWWWGDLAGEHRHGAGYRKSLSRPKFLDRREVAAPDNRMARLQTAGRHFGHSSFEFVS